MLSAFERMVALRYLRARRQEGFISVIAWFSLLGITLGVATLIIVMSVMNGFRHELLGRILGVNGHITLYAPAGGAFPEIDDLTAKLRATLGVAVASPMVEGQVMASARTPGGSTIAGGAQVRGMKREDIERRALISNNIYSGSLDEFKGDGVLIGTRMAGRMGLSVGSDITLLSPNGQTTVIGNLPRVKTYKVAGIFEVGMYEYDNLFIYMPYDTAATFFMTGGGNAFEVMVENAQESEIVAMFIRGLVEPGVRVLDWRQANSSFFTAVQVERNVMFLILTLIILVAAFNIISSMIMLVKDKTRDIAVLRTMGATRGMILRIFLLAGSSVGVIGSATGFALGLLFCRNIQTIREALEKISGTNLFQAEIYFLSRLPAIVDMGEVAQVVGMALVLSVLATIYPALRAARLDPVEALRYE